MPEDLRVERLPIVKSVLAVLVNFHLEKQELIRDLEGSNPSEKLAQLWAEAGDIAYHMINEAKQHEQSEGEGIKAEFLKKATFLAKLEINADKKVLNSCSFKDYERSSDSLNRLLEEKPYEAVL